MANAARSGASGPPPSSPTYSGEEYRLYYESTEKVIDRRLALNAWNYGICIAILIASGFLANWAISKSELRLVLLVGIGLGAAMGAMLCYLWRGQISDYKKLNNAKFEVLNAMAPRVQFDDARKSFEPFRREWEILAAQKVVVKPQGGRIAVLQSSKVELLIPMAFLALYLIVLMVVLILIAVNWSVLQKDAFSLPAAERVAELRRDCSDNC
ncbi:MAG: hypothetical protein WBR13_11225 [Allosphingosinicella sp.]